mmetsp:Transcript_11750/g.30151  ORF Transcript_11750/g.30151 Transcript_11750/m.30151 type:complete len:277 (+) Transcript_11750:37-867(+)
MLTLKSKHVHVVCQCSRQWPGAPRDDRTARPQSTEAVTAVCTAETRLPCAAVCAPPPGWGRGSCVVGKLSAPFAPRARSVYLTSSAFCGTVAALSVVAERRAFSHPPTCRHLLPCCCDHVQQRPGELCHRPMPMRTPCRVTQPGLPHERICALHDALALAVVTASPGKDAVHLLGCVERYEVHPWTEEALTNKCLDCGRRHEHQRGGAKRPLEISGHIVSLEHEEILVPQLHLERERLSEVVPRECDRVVTWPRLQRHDHFRIGTTSVELRTAPYG